MLSSCKYFSKSPNLFSLFGSRIFSSRTNLATNTSKILLKSYYIPSTNASILSNSVVRGYFGPFHINICKSKFHSSARNKELNLKNNTTFYYLLAFTTLVGGLTYSSVLLYRLYCQTTGKGGKAVMEQASEKIANMVPVKQRLITVNFNADVNTSIKWNFKPQQHDIKVLPGETALAFYTATNPSDTPITGVATYNVLPFEAGKYLNKIQCFCFEEQRLNPHEEVDMPVFFYLDPEFAEDPFLEHIHDIYLSYCFFEAKEGVEIPLPGFMRNK